MRDLFERARGCGKPCIIFFDEFEAMAPKRGTSMHWNYCYLENSKTAIIRIKITLKIKKIMKMKMKIDDNKNKNYDDDFTMHI